ncbi:MAG: peptidoglycan editing factor PgeF [Fidelibacterota bacterium]
MILGESGFPYPLKSELSSAVVSVGLDGMEPAFCRQIHSDRIFVARSAGLVGDGDGMVSVREDLALCIQTADCVPIFMVAPDEGIIGLVHAGWRGTSRGIVIRALERMRALSRINPGPVEVFMGPSIGPCCYEVAQDVGSRFDQRVQFRNAQGGCHLDLTAANRLQMESWGVEPANITQDGRCTSCDSLGFHSYRRDGTDAGRMICVMALKEDR